MTLTHTRPSDGQSLRGESGLRLDRAQTRALHALHADWAVKIAEALRESLHAPTVTLQSLQETTSAQHRTQLGRPDHAIGFAAASPQAGVLECRDGLALLMLDHLLACGGSLAAEDRALSEIEAQLLSGVLEAVLEAYAAQWAPHVTAPFRLAETPSGAPDEPLFTATYAITTAAGAGRLTVLLRLAAWREALGAFRARPGEGRPAPTPNTGLLSVIGECQLSARVLLGSTRMPVADLLGLRAGDIICLDQPHDAPLAVHIGGRARVHGRAQVRHGQYVVIVDGNVPREDA